MQEMHEMPGGNVKSRFQINGSMIDEDDFEGPSQESDVQANVRKDTLEREWEEIENFD